MNLDQSKVNIPWKNLSEEALRGVIEEFVLREGTEYGRSDVALDQKIAQIHHQLTSGKAEIMFDPATETTTIIPIPQ